MRVYFSCDIETDGVVAGRNNMLSLGCAAIDMDYGVIVGRFKSNLSLSSGLEPDEDTMLWWKGFPEMYQRARENAVHPERSIQEFVNWVDNTQTVDSIIFAWKPVMDLAFLRYYVHRFHPQGKELVINGIYGRQGFGLDQKTAAAIALGQTYRKTKMSNLPDSLRLDYKGEVMSNHSHDALEDAEEQAYIFWNTVRRLRVDL